MKAYEVLENAAEQLELLSVWVVPNHEGCDISDELAAMMRAEAANVRDGWITEYAQSLLSIAEKITGEKAEQ